MRQISVFIAVQVWCLCIVEGYRIFSMKDSGSCLSNTSVEIRLSSVSRNSSGILIYDTDSKYTPNLHCLVTLRPPISYGIVVSIRSINLQPYAKDVATCQNYLELSSVRGYQVTKLCGYSDDEFEFKSYIHWGKTKVAFHTSNSSQIRKASFQLTFTAIRRGNNWCFRDETRCHSGHCIWRGLACDGHNNCGDLSEEMDKFIAQCNAMSSGESLAVILITIIGALVLLTIAAYLRGPKISREIERMSQCRRAACPPGGNPTEPGVTQSNVNSTTAPTINRLRSNYGSTSGLLSSYNYSETSPYDPPPRYEEFSSLPVVTVQSSITIESPPCNTSNSTNENEVRS